MNQRKWIILVNLLVVLAFFNYQIIQKESILQKAKLILIPLAPLDPRSLMQGDFMRLRYDLRQELNYDSYLENENTGYLIVRLNKNKVGTGLRLQKNVEPLAADEYPIRFHYTDRGIRIGAESYFFEEGSGDKFSEARYGGLKVSPTGEPVLIGLYNKKYQLIKP